MSGILDKLRTSTCTSVPLFSLEGLVTYAKLVKNYDGDTGDIVLVYNDTLMHVKARFYGYDTCEMKPPLSDPNRESKKARAVAAKQRLWHLCTGTREQDGQHTTLMKIKCGKFDKYGRLLVVALPEIYDISNKSNDELFEESINNIMLTEGHGYKYEGGTKQDF